MNPSDILYFEAANQQAEWLFFGRDIDAIRSNQLENEIPRRDAYMQALFQYELSNGILTVYELRPGGWVPVERSFWRYKREVREASNEGNPRAFSKPKFIPWLRSWATDRLNLRCEGIDNNSEIPLCDALNCISGTRIVEAEIIAGLQMPEKEFRIHAHGVRKRSGKKETIPYQCFIGQSEVNFQENTVAGAKGRLTDGWREFSNVQIVPTTLIAYCEHLKRLAARWLGDEPKKPPETMLVPNSSAVAVRLNYYLAPVRDAFRKEHGPDPAWFGPRGDQHIRYQTELENKTIHELRSAGHRYWLFHDGEDPRHISLDRILDGSAKRAFSCGMFDCTDRRLEKWREKWHGAIIFIEEAATVQHEAATNPMATTSDLGLPEGCISTQGICDLIREDETLSTAIQNWYREHYSESVELMQASGAEGNAYWKHHGYEYSVPIEDRISSEAIGQYVCDAVVRSEIELLLEDERGTIRRFAGGNFSTTEMPVEDILAGRAPTFGDHSYRDLVLFCREDKAQQFLARLRQKLGVVTAENLGPRDHERLKAEKQAEQIVTKWSAQGENPYRTAKGARKWLEDNITGLSGKAAERAWANAARPEWKRAGPKGT